MTYSRLSQSIVLWLAFCSIDVIHTMDTDGIKDLIDVEIAQLLRPSTPNCSYADQAMRIERCIELGTPVDGTPILDNVFFAPLIVACLYKDPKLVESLLDKGASRKVFTENYSCPFHAVLHIYKTGEEDQDTFKKVLKFYLEQLPLSQEAIIISQLIGHKPLITAAQDNNEQLARRCLAYGLNPNAQDNRGRTALMCAVENNAVGIVRALLDHGADITITDASARTAIDYAKRTFDSELKKQLTLAPAFTHTRIPLQYLLSTKEELDFAEEVHQKHLMIESAPQQMPTATAQRAGTKPKSSGKKKTRKSSRRKTVKQYTYEDGLEDDNDEEYKHEEAPQENQSLTGFIRPEFIKSFKKSKSKK